MRTYYCTFGFGQALEGRYCAVSADNVSEAHQKMYAEYGGLWSFCYPAAHKADAIDAYGLIEVPFGTKNWRK